MTPGIGPKHRFSMDDLYFAIDEMTKITAKHKTIVIAGSQAILASITPEAWKQTQGLQHSWDIDVFCIPEMETNQRLQINQSMGETSIFFKTNNWGIEPIGEWVMLTSIPEWPERMVKINTPKENSGYCISPLDIIYNKAEAGRKKDIDYIFKAIKCGLIKISQIVEVSQK